jgi:hypothetical protein
VLQALRPKPNDFRHFQISPTIPRNTAVQFSFAVTGGVIASPRRLRFEASLIT